MVVNGGSGESAYAYLTVHTRTVPYSHPLDVVGPTLPYIQVQPAPVFVSSRGRDVTYIG